MAESSALGARLRELRLARGLSQRDVGGRELSASYVSLVESGKRRPTAEALRTMCEQLGTTPQAIAADGGVAVPRTRAEVELDLKWAKIAIRAGNPASAEKYARVVLEDGSLDERDRLEALSLLAAATEGQGRLEEAIELLEDLRSQIDAGRTRELWINAQVMLMRCYKDSGDLGHAVTLGEQAMTFFGDVVREQELVLVISLADAHGMLGNSTRATMLLRNAISRAEADGSRRSRGQALWNASIVAADRGNVQDAVVLAEQALGLLSESESVRHVSRLHATCAYVLLENDGPNVAERARRHLESALEGVEMEDSVVEQARVVADLARCDLVEGRLDDAEIKLLRASALLHGGDEGADMDSAFVDLVQAHVLVARGHVERGLALAQDAAARTEEHDSRAEAARTWQTVAELADGCGDHDLLVTAIRRSSTLVGVRPTRVALPTREAVESHQAALATDLTPEDVLAGRE